MSKQDSPFEIGGFWLDRREDSPNWYRCHYDATARGTNRRGREVRASLGTSDLQQAKLDLAAWVLEYNKPAQQDPGDVMVDELLLAYWREHAKDIASAEGARNAMKKWSDYYGTKRLSEVTPKEQKLFIADLLYEQQLSPGYAKRVIGVGKAAINHAYNNGRISSVPKIILPSVPDSEHRQLTPTEVRRLFEETVTPHAFMYLLLAFTTLAREQTLLELTWYQVDVPNRIIKLNAPGRVQTKKRRPTVPITNVLYPYVQQRREGTVVQYRGKPIASVKTMLKQAGKRAGIGPIGSRVIRHTMATVLRSEGVPLWDIEALLGHKAPSTSETYAAHTPDYMSVASAAIDKYLTENVGVVLAEKAKELKIA